MDEIIVTILCIGGIAFTYWFFFMKREDIAVASGEITIIVEGGYRPDTIKLTRGTKTIIKFLRKDANSCLEEVVIPEFGIKKYLPLHKVVSVEILPEKIGTFPFACGMNMFHGKFIVED